MSKTKPAPTFAPAEADGIELADVLQTIDDYRELEADWDAEGGLPVTEQTIALAKKLVREIAAKVRDEGIAWHKPNVSPDGSGRVHLVWERGNRSTLLIVDGAKRDSIVSVTQIADSKPVRDVVPFHRAVKDALWAMGGS